MERVEQFFLANDVDNAHKEPTLLSFIGGKTYTQQTVATLQEHLSPKPLEIVPLWWKHTYDRCTVVFTRTRFATTVKNRAIFSGFVVPNSKASRSKQPKPPTVHVFEVDVDVDAYNY